MSFGTNSITIDINLNLSDSSIPVPVLAPFIIDFGFSTNIEIRVLYRSDGDNVNSPNLFALSTFISSNEGIDFIAEAMILAEWKETSSDIPNVSNSIAH